MSDLRAEAANRDKSRVAAALAASLRMLQTRAVVSLSLGAAVVLSLLSVCCGVGLFTTPWFMCELFAVQLALCTGQSIRRGTAFVPAGVILLGAVLMISAVAAISLLGAGTSMSTEPLPLDSLGAVLRSGGVAALLSSVVALIVVVPLLYAPLFLIEQRTSFDLALVESVRLMVARGVFASVRLSLFAHLLQVAPLMIGTFAARLIEPAQAAWFALAATPFLCVTVPLGQGMIVCDYVQQRERVANPQGLVPCAPGETLPRSAQLCARGWGLLLALPIASLLLLELSLWRPSHIPEGRAPVGDSVATLTPRDGRLMRVLLPDTALEVAASAHEVRVSASDGGGAGTLPLQAASAVERVHVVRVRDAFVIVLQQGGREYVTSIDRAGVRLDDDLRARLMDRVSPLQLLLFLCTLLATGLASVPVLYSLGRVRREYRLPNAERPSREILSREHERSLRRARNLAILLLPLGLACLTMALLALLKA
jgi:hypothetical protein